MADKPLRIFPVNDYEMGPYNYFVITPSGDYMYFEEKKQAKEFIEFYVEYSKKHPDKV